MNLMIKVFHVQDVNETREEEARGEDAADYDAADADYEQEDDAGASSGGGSSRARKSRKTHWVPPPKVPAREEDKILIVPCGDE